jgi:hypothetical protein
MTLVGTAEVVIKAVESGIESDIKRKVDKAVSKADKDVKIGADTKGAEASIGRLNKLTTTGLDDITSRLTSGLGPASGEAKAALDGLTKSGSLIGPAIAGGVAIAGVALAAFAIDGAQKFVALAGEIRGFQRVSGASAEESSRFVAVLDDLGVSAQTGGNAVFMLSKKVAAGGDDIRKLGIDIATTKDGTADLTETLLNVADAYVAQSDPAKRAEIAFAAFGRQGKELIPVLEQGREGLKKFFEGAEGGRQIFSQEDLDKARKFELAMDDLSDTFRGIQMEAGEALLPFLTSLATAGAKVLEFGNLIKDKLGKTAFDSLTEGVAGALGGPLAQLGGLLGNLGGKGDGAKKSQKELAEQVKLTAAAQHEEAEASKEQAAALDKVTNATLSAVSSQLGYESSLNSLKDNINDIDDRTTDYTEAVDKAAEANRLAEVAVRQYGVGSDEAKEATERAKDAAKDAEQANRSLRDAHLGVEQSALQAAGAAVKLADDTAASEGKMLSAQDKAHIFRNALVELANQADGPTKQAILNLADQVLGLPDSKTIYVDADTSSAVAAISSLERRLASISAGADSTAGPLKEFARGMDVGPVPGSPSQAMPILAHGGEWVLTPEQLADLRRNSAGLSSVTTSTLSASTALTITGPLVVVQGGVAPGQEAGIGAAVRQAVTQLVADGTVGRAMSKRSETMSRR